MSKSLIEDPRPGQFRARCTTGAYLPIHELTEPERLRAEAEDAELRDAGRHRGVFRYDRKRKVEMARVPCALDTTDRDEYLAHMLRFHGKKPGGPHQLRKPKIRSKIPAAGPEEGRPFKASTKAIAETVETCPHCGLVAEIRGIGFGRNADARWWQEHVTFCAERDTEDVA